ncbi:MAG TPA: tetratricopeptide repeat protein [Candidatus Parcubacteria bacterium]|nr:tetratricopeptide repeat protein [Candidatus Parcubacteria bacterium]
MNIAKTETDYVKKWETIAKAAVYLLTFLLPLFFLPFTPDVLNFNKQAILLFLSFFAFFAWMLKILISGKISFSLNWVHIPLIVLVLVSLISTIVSFYSYGSFWGWPQSASESFLTLLCFTLFYFLAVSVFEKKEIFYIIVYLIFSTSLAMLFSVFQLFGKFLLPFSFSKTFLFNTIGTAGSMAVFAAVLLPILTFAVIKVKKRSLRIFFIVDIILSVLVLSLTNFFIAWWLVIIGSVLVITLMAQKRDVLDNRWLILPMFFLAVALLFTLLKIQIPGAPNLSGEVFLTQKASLDVALKTLKSNPVFGTGPGTFIFDFSKYKNADFNNTQLWNIRFGRAGSEFFNLLATTGILGALSFLVLVLASIFLGIKFLFLGERKKRKEDVKDKKVEAVRDKGGSEIESFLLVTGYGIFVSFLVLVIACFLYNLNLSLKFVFFLLLAGLVALGSKRRSFVLKPSSLATLGFTFFFTIFLVFGLGVFILETQRYVAAVDYQKGIGEWQKGNDAEAVKYVEKATRINPGIDLYWNQLAQLYTRRIGEIAADKKMSKDEANMKIQLYINNAINSAKAAVDTSPKNVANWSVRGLIYQNLIGLVSGVGDWAIKSYETALSLEPLNPYFPTQEGLVYLQQASLLGKDKKEEKAKLFEKAKTQFNRAIELKNDYAPAHFQLAMIYQSEGKQKEAIKKLEATKRIAPFDIGLAFQLGLSYYQDKDYQKARQELERAITMNSKYSNAIYFLGLTYYKLGLNDKSIEQFEKLSKLNPDNEQVKKILENLKSGKDVFEGLVQKKPPEAPITEKPEKR